MSIATLIDEAAREGRFVGTVLVIFQRPAQDMDLTLQWDEEAERWLAICSDETHRHYAWAQNTPSGSDDVAAVVGALDAYLDALNHGIGNPLRGTRDRVDSANLWARERIAFYNEQQQ